MKVTLTQYRDGRILRGWILIRLENQTLCTEVRTSSTFDPYRELYIWLGQIRDSQIPEKMIIDEEGKGVELVVEKVETELLHFHIEPWFCGNDRATRFSETIASQELIEAFCHGIVEFIRNEYDPLEWSIAHSLSNLNWEALLQPTIAPSQNWKMRLALHGGGRGRVPDTGRKSIKQDLTTEQQGLIVLYDALYQITSLIYYGEVEESYTLANLYQNSIVDLILNEFDPSWYEQRRMEIDRVFGDRKGNVSERTLKHSLKHKRLQSQAQLSTLQVGQLVDGRVSSIRSYGVLVDIGGHRALLSISTISRSPIDCPSQIFEVNDWVRAIVVWIDVEKGRVLLSTRDLEPEPGDMLRNPLSVYERGEEMANRFRQKVRSSPSDE